MTVSSGSGAAAIASRASRSVAAGLLASLAAPRLGTTIATPARSSPVSFTPFRRLSSRADVPRPRATSSSVSPKRKVTVSSLSAAVRAPSRFAA